LCRSRASILFHCMACLPMHHPMLYMCSMRTSTTPLIYPLRANNPSLGMHMSLNPCGRHMKYPEITLWPTLSLTLDMPLRGKHLVAYPSQTPRGALSIAHNHNFNPYIFSVGRLPPAIVEREKFDHIEERLRAIEGSGDYPFANMAELCLVPDVIIPLKFKVLDFDKYKGTTCPKNHLKMYCRKMGAYTKDEKLLMHFFQESLAGAAITWYTNMESSRIHS